MSFRRLHAVGCDVLGAGASDFVPWLGIVGKAMGGISDVLSPNQQKADPAAQQKAIEQAIKAEEQRQALMRAQEQAAKDRAILLLVLGVVGVAGVGATVMLVRKK